MADNTVWVGLIAGGSALLGVVVSSSVQLIVEHRRHLQDLERDRLVHARAVLDAKRERIFEAYSVFLNAAETHQDVVARVKYLMAGETEESRDAQLARALGAAMESMNKATVTLELEEASGPALKLFGEIRQAYVGYMSGLNMNSQFAGTGNATDVSAYENALKTRIEELRAFMRAHLKAYELPAQSSEQQKRWWQFWVRSTALPELGLKQLPPVDRNEP